MKLPEAFLESLEGVAGFEREPFVAVHEKEEGVTSIRINPAKWTMGDTESTGSPSPFTIDHSRLTPVPWSRYGFYLDKRPSFTFDPLFHAGCYYVQEASSMFLEQALTQLADLSEPLTVLDLCAAPGGKSTHIQSLLHPASLLVSNEVIKSRNPVLIDNIVKWGSSNVFVTNNDPKAFQKLPGYFDVMVVDAPCSGSGLFRKDESAIAEWSPNNVVLCSQRQQRILADALPALKEEGLLVYSTCSYSTEEDEAIMDWLVLEMEMENVALAGNLADGIVATTSPTTKAAGYRFYPDKIRGEGFFLSCFRKKIGGPQARLKVSKPELLPAREKKIIGEWVNETGMEFFRFRNGIIAVPAHRVNDFAQLLPLLNLQYAGVAVGQILKEKLVPEHALAQSLLLPETVAATDLDYAAAIRYLQRQDLPVVPQTLGWQVVRYETKNLGWINALKNRVNNYYPKEIRILKQNNTPFAK
ncbi:methyltransferase RsmF C-terminal domain-like protein [Flavisolibacter nicotianae]|uniref:methyltransferase RsmF C-terminal domain-like protein n=1 Tax=Flavisolibacter nicotianae TaxID=2364882 RepID=UPI000EB515F0|nr:Fmu (Sun) domain protein [Flavisolibacter nicotianae]